MIKVPANSAADSAEILNLDYHKKRLTLIALNRHKRILDAADALGVGDKTLWRYRVQYDIQYCQIKNIYYSTKNDLCNTAQS